MDRRPDPVTLNTDPDQQVSPSKGGSGSRIRRVVALALGGLVLLGGGVSAGYLVGTRHELPAKASPSHEPSPSPTQLADCLAARVAILSVLDEQVSTARNGLTRVNNTGPDGRAEAARKTAASLLVFDTKLRTVRPTVELSEAYADATGASGKIVAAWESLASAYANAGSFVEYQNDLADANALLDHARAVLGTFAPGPCE